jgi:branched-chain amino acid transport system ATP-binding protein
LLEVSSLTCRFGGVLALNEVSFSVEEGKVYSIIGPNGAGKTTLFNLISGIYTPTRGEIRLRGQPIQNLRPETLAKQGMSRTFQNLQLCMNVGAIENVMIGAHLRLNSAMIAGILNLSRVRSGDRECREEAARWMQFAGVEKYLSASTDQMPYGALKRLEIARALISKPQLLLLDEPAAGLNSIETLEVEELVRKVAGTGVTVLLIEHDMKLVMSISDQILVMHHGARLFEGTPEEVRMHPEVVAAYLGSDFEEDA